MCVKQSIFTEAIEAMKNAHKQELEKTQRSQLSGLNSEIDELCLQYEYVHWQDHHFLLLLFFYAVTIKM